jgi:Uma2 family endonuclease
MSVKQKMVTAEELWEMPEGPGKRFELVDGEVIEVSPAGDLHMTIAEIVYKRLDRFVEQHNLGLVRFNGLGYVIKRGPDQVRVPDVSFVAWEGVPEGEPSEWFWEGPPTLAVEVVSQDDLALDFRDRVYDYLEARTQQVWVLWPRTRRVSGFSPNANTREFDPDSTLDGGSLLPGFSVSVGDLFEVPRRPGC